MELLEKIIDYNSRATRIRLRPIGDVHVGSPGCMERWLQRQVEDILKNEHDYVVLGGDLIDGVNHLDKRRFDFDAMADWVLAPEIRNQIDRAMTVRHRLSNLVEAQAERLCGFLKPLADAGRIVGAVEGNHEFSVMKFNGFDVHNEICRELGIQDLTAAAMIRFKMRRHGKKINDESGRFQTTSETIWVEHGTGGGRSRGSEMNHLGRLLGKSDCRICLRGHSHTYTIAPPDVVMTLPGVVTRYCEAGMEERWAANWGTYKVGYKRGLSSYIERAGYSPRASWTAAVEFWPGHCNGKTTVPLRCIKGVPLHTDPSSYLVGKESAPHIDEE